jgi:hypothetical protein
MAIKKTTVKKPLRKAQVGTIVKDSTSRKSDLDKVKEIDNMGPIYFKEYIKNIKPAPKEKKETPMAKKGGAKKSLPKGQTGLGIGQGPNNTVAKSNINAKIAAGAAALTTAIGLGVNKIKKNREARLEKLKKEQASENQQVAEKKKGGSTGDKKWIQKAINPKHKGYCTPMTKPTCTPKRKALAKTLKKMAKNR